MPKNLRNSSSIQGQTSQSSRLGRKIQKEHLTIDFSCSCPRTLVSGYIAYFLRRIYNSFIVSLKRVLKITRHDSYRSGFGDTSRSETTFCPPNYTNPADVVYVYDNRLLRDGFDSISGKNACFQHGGARFLPSTSISSLHPQNQSVLKRRPLTFTKPVSSYPLPAIRLFRIIWTRVSRGAGSGG